ncbi:DUF3055 domain-containing protein [Alicyclobacillus sp. ALC3]|uniref:DUF3055 domain-containing protein n=1 Tax=Alicyclobacillus sp. ALC3 TaxID=2796143 RepID=UPI002378E08C|nr:DUF3055 domain-containing protein [Alicyclobacillus sp. ALC3]WDL97469.1 DUF3055 domain-containing protein [Alicyclobacillus sp. ALC3]
MNHDGILYDETEHTSTRYVGYAGEHGRYDIAVTSTTHFYGKRLVFVIQSGKTAIMNDDDAANTAYVMDVFGVTDEAEGTELAQFLLANL